jgi:hypothetical protein
MIKDGQDADRPHAHKARGLSRHKLALMKEDQMRHGGSSTEASLKHNMLKPSKESPTPPRPRGLHPAGALARTHQKSNDATTPVHNSLSLCKSVHTPAKAQGLLLGT